VCVCGVCVCVPPLRDDTGTAHATPSWNYRAINQSNRIIGLPARGGLLFHIHVARSCAVLLRRTRGGVRRESGPPLWSGATAPLTAGPAEASGTFNPLHGVLCILRSLYLCAIGPRSVCHLVRDTPHASNCSPKPLYSGMQPAASRRTNGTQLMCRGR